MQSNDLLSKVASILYLQMFGPNDVTELLVIWIQIALPLNYRKSELPVKTVESGCIWIVSHFSSLHSSS